MEFTCPNCHYVFKYDSEWSNWARCPKCKGEAIAEKPWNFVVNRYVDVTAFGTDEHGETVGVTKKGKRVDPSQTRYNFHKDPHGWKAVGKKVREYDSKGVKYGD